MDLSLSDEQRAVRERLPPYSGKESTPQRVRTAESDRHRRAALAAATPRSMRWVSAVPSDCGGADGGLLELALVAEEAGRRLAPIPVAETAAAARLLGRLAKKSCWGRY